MLIIRGKFRLRRGSFARADRKIRTRFRRAALAEVGSCCGCQKDLCPIGRGLFWHPQRESNPQLPLRRGLLYPFNYAGVARGIIPFLSVDCKRFLNLVKFYFSLPSNARTPWFLGGKYQRVIKSLLTFC